MEKGDIVLVPFPFTNLSGSKKRPALILACSKLDVTVCFISTRLYWRENIDLVLSPVSENGLKKESLVRTRKIASIDLNLIIGKLGSINTDQLKELDSNLIELFDIKFKN
ncbi:MAG: type II toxin-antitoxin system PemK/MazF family toxin [Salibacter sp.]|uniref:type II toxin-antitoxin system PemK/MazF family toxin n=1 Tax=Salibacter sp. TaxID=2010995 RepID=UPI0028702EFB|nr:type II toxin-antitoxin system PemK/MazF family toxin [Salibacter sp.]MDR9399433.1 type II toxin-antitoxin system PemK/MazF family toxin [Salibacter sp.]